MARAAAWYPDEAETLAARLAAQIESFVAGNPWSKGIHWMSGQETVIRLMAWLFAFDVLLSRSSTTARMRDVIGDAILAGAAHVEGYLEYARRAVYNNHLLSEALGLYLAGSLFRSSEPGQRWLRVGGAILAEQAERQFYTDGAYIQQSHMYHRLAVQVLIWACLMCRAGGGKPAPEWTSALERSLDFLVAHQNPGDGQLPNYGSNDGALPSPLSSCDFTDFRPTLQAVSLLTRGERLYDPGPWDEQTAWMLGPMALEAPLRAPDRCSISFGATGYHVLRGREPETFAAFRCGTLRDRFSQVDMLHVDVWWRGLNVLVDAGSYLYNGPARWHEHFFRTPCHNTVALDGHDQMLHTRRFKVVYWTRARLLSFRDHDDWSSVSGEHYGYQRRPGGCVHRRSVLFMKDDLWIVADTILGTGSHAARLHWLGGPYPFSASPEHGSMRLDTPLGPFGVTVFDMDGSPVPVTVVAGQDDPPRGWLSRYYGEKAPVPSMAADVSGSCPITLLSILGPIEPQLGIADDRFEVRTPGAAAAFTMTDGVLTPLRA
jgi:asparagine synthase (glutamine-hydrolysing)